MWQRGCFYWSHLFKALKKQKAALKAAFCMIK
jgi:hypothetical protein